MGVQKEVRTGHEIGTVSDSTKILPVHNDPHIVISRISELSDVTKQGINTCYIRGMLKIVRENKSDQAVEQIISEFWNDFVDHNLYPKEEVRRHLFGKQRYGKRLQHVGALTYQTLFELSFIESELDEREFGLFVGRYGAEENALFTFASAVSPNFLMNQATSANKDFNIVTDMHPMRVHDIIEETITHEGGNIKKKIRESICERVIDPEYLSLLEQNFSLDDVEKILRRDFYTTEGVMLRIMAAHNLWGEVTTATVLEKEKQYLNKSFLEDEKYNTEIYRSNPRKYTYAPYHILIVRHDSLNFGAALWKLAKSLNPLKARKERMDVAWEYSLAQQREQQKTREIETLYKQQERLSRKLEEARAAEEKRANELANALQQLELATEAKLAAERETASAQQRAQKADLTRQYASHIEHHGRNTALGLEGGVIRLKNYVTRGSCTLPELTELLKDLEENVGRLRGDLTDFRAFNERLSRSEDDIKKRLEAVNLNEIVNTILRTTTPTLQEKRKYIPFDVVYQEQIPLVIVNANRHELTDTITNLLTNAVEAIFKRMNDLELRYIEDITVNKYNFEISKTQKESELDTYRASEDYKRYKRGDVFGTVKIIVNQESVYGKIIIEDNGVGMTEETMKKMYDPGFTEGKPDKSLGIGGTGFGLTAVKQCVEDYSGQIFCESKKGTGTTFTLLFPKKQGSQGSE